MEHFSTQWFMAYYISLGALLVSFGVYLLIKTDLVKGFLVDASEQKKPPTLWRKVLRYFLFFTIPCFVLSFFPFSWVELFFSIWSLLMVFMLGQLLVMWPQTSKAIQEQSEELEKKIRFVAANLLSIGIILFLLCYVLIERTNST